MRFRRIALNNLRQFTSPLVVEFADPAFNLICGDNEEGKSTLLLALQAALFERYDRAAGERLRPYNAAVSPEVEIDFTLDGCAYHLHKVFSRRSDKRAELSNDRGARWEGPEAEEQLQQLLGFSLPTRGESRAELQGIAGLLWVNQTRAFEAVEPGTETRNRLLGTLDSEIDQLLGGEHGQRLLQNIGARLEQYLGRSGKPIGEYRRLIDAVTSLKSELETVAGELSQYDSQIDQLQTLTDRQEEYRRQGALDNARHQLEQARAAHSQLQTLQRQVEEAESACRLAEARLRQPRSEWQQRQLLIRDCDELGANIGQMKRTLETRAQAHTPLMQQLAEVDSELETLESRRQQATRELEVLHREQTLWESHRTLQAMTRNRESAAIHLQRLTEIQDLLANLQMDQQQIAELERLSSAMEKIRQASELAGTQLEFQLEQDQSITLDGQPLQGSGERSITRETLIDLAGIGRLILRPRGKDLSALSDELERHHANHQAMLDRLGVASLEQALAAWQQKQDLQRELQLKQTLLDTLIPEGLAQIDAELHRLRNLLSEGAVPECQPDPAMRVTLQGEIDRLSAIHQQKMDAKRRLQQESERIGEELLTLRSRLSVEQEGLRRLEGRLQDARTQISDSALEQALADASAAVEQCRKSHQQASARLDQANPEAIELQMQRAQISHDNLATEIDRLDEECAALRNHLAGMGHGGLAERRDELAAALMRQQILLEREQQQAEALQLLHATLADTLRETKALVAAPMIAKMQPYLEILMPDARALISDDMGLSGVTRNGIEEAFSNLSIGTREQIAIITRLAYADLLYEAGQPVCLFLDDALVYSDDRRRDLMKQILFKASRRYQINLLTCHEAAYRDSGAGIVRLSGIGNRKQVLVPNHE